MPETSSAKTAEAVTPFASPMLESIERLVSRLASRIAGPQSQFSGRSLQFADRVFSRRLGTLGTAGVAPETVLTEREIEPQKWLLPSSWVPSAEALRAGARGAQAPTRAATAAPPAETRAPAPPLTLATPPLTPAGASAPAREAAHLPLPWVSPTPETASGAAAGPSDAPPAAPLGSSPSSVSAAPGQAPVAVSTAPAVAPPAPVAVAPAAATTAASVASAVTGAPLAPPLATAAGVPGAAGSSPRTEEAPSAPGRAASEQALPQVMPTWSPEPKAKAAQSVAPSAGAAAQPAASAIAPRNEAAAPGPAAAGVLPASTPETAPAASAAPFAGAVLEPSPAALAAAAPGLAELPSSRPLSPATAGVGAQTERDSVGGTVAPVGPPRQQAAVGSAPAQVATAAGRSGATADGALRRSAPGSAPERRSASAPLPSDQGETRVRDWLHPLIQRQLATAAPVAGRSSALARSLGHLGWSDERLGQGAQQRGRALAQNFMALTEPESSPRAAAAPALQLVRATDLTPRGAARPAKQPVSATPPAVAPATAQRPATPAAPPALPFAAADGSGAAGTGLSSAAATAAATATTAVGELTLGRAAPAALEAGREAPRSEAAPPPSAAGTSVERPFHPDRRGAASPASDRTATRAAARADGSAAALFSPLSPGLLASPVLREPREARGAATLIGLFAAGQPGRAGMPAGGPLPSLAASRLAPSPGSLATHTERLAMAIGTHAAAGSAGVDNPFGGVQDWGAAPGLARVVARALDGDGPAGAVRRTQLGTAGALPYLPSPDRRLSAVTRAATAARTPSLKPSALPTADPRGVPAPAVSSAASPEAAASPLYRPQTGAEAPLPAQLRTPAEEPVSGTSAERPWRLAGGMATLAELFAAGIGLGTGAAGDLARKAGVSSAIGVTPPWLARAESRSRFGLLGGPTGPARPGRRSAELELVDLSEGQKTAASEDPAASAAPRLVSAAPVAEPAQPAAVAPVPSVLPPAASPSAAPLAPAPAAQPPFWQQAGGLAATAEAFARSHGIDHAERLSASGPAAAAAGRWVPVTGGVMFIGEEPPRSATAAAAAGPSRSILAGTQPQDMVPERSPKTGAGRHIAAAEGSGGLLGPWPQPSSPAESAPSALSSREAARTRGGAMSLLRGIDWGRAGGLGLRTELMAAGLDSTGLRALALSAADERAAWSMAPGVASPLARALRTSRAQPMARWTMGDNGLLFVSGPDSPGDSASAGAAASAASAAGPSGRSPSALPSAAAQPRFPRVPATGSPPSGEVSPQPGTEYAAGTDFSALGGRPWLQAGGTALLAELFSAGVGLSAGAVSGLAQQAGVAAGRGLLPGWLLRLLRAAGPTADDDEQSRRTFGGALPFVTPDERASAAARRTAGLRPARLAPSVAGPGQVLPTGQGRLAAEHQPWSLTAAATASSLWPQVGGLGASAEAFARGRGMVRADGEASGDDDSGESPAGRWLPVSGGMVFVPAERPAASRGKRVPAQTRPGVGSATGPATAPPAAAPAARPLDWPYAGGLGLRSELFTSGLGPSATGGAALSSDPLGGWAGAHQLLASFPRQETPEATPPRRFAWSGAGGLLYLSAASPPPRAQRRTAAAAHRAAGGAAGPAAIPGVVAATSSGGRLPGGLAALAERFSTAAGSEPTARELEAGTPGSSALPLAALTGGRGLEQPTAASGGGSVSGAMLAGRLAEKMLTGLARPVGGESDAADAAWPRAALHSVERLSKLLSQLPAKWHPSAAMTTAMQAGGVADSPMWQRLSPNLTRLAATALRPEAGGSADEGGEDGAGERHTHLTLVKGSSPGAAQKAQRAAEPAWKQQTPQAMVSAALQKVAGSGTPMAAAAKMLESVRGQSGMQASRPDDRISLGDLTLIAISMGENRMAAISKSQSPSPVPHVESALRQDDTQLVQPETEHTMNQKVDALAKMCLKYVEKHEQMMKERGSFDA